MNSRIHILGASGSGTTTLGEAIADQIGVRHLDTDDFYWEPTQIRFSKKRTVEKRLELIFAEIKDPKSWVLSGSFCSWGDPLLTKITHVIFLQTPWVIRKQRLITREQSRYGEHILRSNEAQGTICRDFLDWASWYDSADLEQRSLATHSAWLNTLPAHIKQLQLDGSESLNKLVKECYAFVS